MTRNTQVHEIDTLGPPLVTDFPAQSNHDFAYVYGNAGHPHQATLIGTRGLTYDLNGNTAAECKGACSFTNQPVRTFQWTEENWLAAVVDGNGKGSPRSSTSTTFMYDGSGQRVVKQNPDTGNSITIGQFFALTGGHAGTKHVFAGDTRVATKLISTTMKSGGPPGGTPGNGTGGAGNQGNGNGGGPQNDNGCVPSNYNPKKCPTVPGAAPTLGGGPGGGGPPTFVAGTFYYHPDHLGSTSWMTDQAGKVREHVEYYPYGEIWRDVRNDLDGNKPTTQEFLFTGKELDPETGLYYFGARYYDPRFARWVSADPLFIESPERKIGVTFELSRYAYVGNNPLRRTDPTGLETVGEYIDRKGVASAGEGSNVSAFGWSFAATAWDYFGAEGVSRITDAAMGQRELGVADIGSAAIEVVSAIPFVKAASEGVKVGVVLLHAGEEKSGKALARAAAVEARAAEKGATKTGGKPFSREKQALVEMAKSDKNRGGMKPEDMEAYKELNKGLPDPFPSKQVRGPEKHPLRTPQSTPGPGQELHGHVGPVEHIPVKETP